MIPTQNRVKTITDMREHAKKLLSQVKSISGPLYILYRSKPQAVLLNLEWYQKLVDMAEDYVDSLKAQEYEKQGKKKVEWLNHKELKELINLKLD